MYTSSVIFRLVCSHILKSTLRCNLSVAILLNVYAEHIIINKDIETRLYNGTFYYDGSRMFQYRTSSKSQL